MNDEVPGYRILQQVGEGGFSLVYRAKQERLDRIVALKVLSVNAVDDATMRRFQRECQITGRLTGHPNVVTVLDTGMTKAGRPYIAMDFFEHGSLRDRLTREGPFPVSDILRIGVKICGALAATHQAEVLHRDVKPQNILVSRYGEPALADFGVARLVDTFEATHTNAFTPHHAAPEVVNGRPPGVSSDIYSLGSTLYQLLAGAPAFKGTTDTGIGPLMLRIINEPPPAINRPDLPPRVFEAIQISMAKEPADRFRTAVDFAARLQQLQSELGLPVTELAGSGALTGLPYTSGPSGPHGSTGPSSGFPGLAGTFPGPGEYVGLPAPGEGVTADPLEHSAFKQLNPGLYPAPTPGAHADVPGGWGPRYGPGAPPAPVQPGQQAQQGRPGQFDNSTPPAPAGVAVRAHLRAHLPNHPLAPAAGPVSGPGPVSAAPWGSAGILPISWAYIRLMGGEGLRRATEVAVLNANYIARRLRDSFPILYTGPNGLVAHECILDLRGLTRETGVTVDDVAKRLIDYGFHAPTMSFPVAGTLMVEPTESEDLKEIDRFCDAMIRIRGEIDRVASGEWPAEESPLRNAPHTAQMLVGEWPYAYTREEAVFPVDSLRAAKYWPPVRRIDGTYGDRNLVCTCPPIETLASI